MIAEALVGVVSKKILKVTESGSVKIIGPIASLLETSADRRQGERSKSPKT